MDGNPELVDGWDVFRTPDGKPVTITQQQVAAVLHAVQVVEAVRKAEGHRSLFYAAGTKHPGSMYAEIYKSRLLGRMLMEGRPPTRTRPPVYLGGPAWELLPGGDPFAPPEA